MIRWIQNRPWQSSIYLALFMLCLFGGIDTISIGLTSILVSSCNALAILLARFFAWLSMLLIVTGTVLAAALDVRPGFAGAIVLFALMAIAAFGNVWQRNLSLPITVFSGAGLLWASIYQSNNLRVFDIEVTSEIGKMNFFLFGLLIILSRSSLTWLAGRLLITRDTHVGTIFDRALSDRIQAKQALEIAEQNERFAIARDISELVIQRVSASISLAEGGIYATKSDPLIAPRVLEQVVASARSGHQELRRLFDMLNNKHEIKASPPRIDDLEALVISFRQSGYKINLRHEGVRFPVDEGAELAIYRIVFDALENIRKHTPVETDATVDFSWTEEGLQILVKDNGVEMRNRGLSLEDLAYTIEEDRRALTETILGAGLTAMSERARIYGGTVEASRVPGVGFTVSAIFPHLKTSAKG
jgi:signal transduction histidine kinase